MVLKKKYICKLCAKDFDTLDEAVTHVKEAHNIDTEYAIPEFFIEGMYYFDEVFKREEEGYIPIEVWSKTNIKLTGLLEKIFKDAGVDAFVKVKQEGDVINPDIIICITLGHSIASIELEDFVMINGVIKEFMKKIGIHGKVVFGGVCSIRDYDIKHRGVKLIITDIELVEQKA